jgi:hypothetical protein
VYYDPQGSIFSLFCGSPKRNYLMINPINIIVIIVILVLCGIFYWFILPLLKYSGKISHKIDEDVLPELLELDKTIITICTATIILTINFIDKLY